MLPLSDTQRTFGRGRRGHCHAALRALHGSCRESLTDDACRVLDGTLPTSALQIVDNDVTAHASLLQRADLRRRVHGAGQHPVDVALPAAGVRTLYATHYCATQYNPYRPQ